MGNVVEWIATKRDGGELAPDQLRRLIERYVEGEVPDYQMSAFLMAVYFQSMTAAELGAWTDAMLHSGDVLDLTDIPGHKVDKHSTGGVGDKVSLILAPLAVAAGLKVPMISGRGLGHTGGTLDKLESIPGFDVDKDIPTYRRLVEEVGCALIGQTDRLAPADRELYALRDVTATVPCIPLIASSIMSKKLAEGIDALVLDVKVGSGAFMKTVEDARTLGETMIEIGAEMDCPVRALLTDMDQPLGLAVGNAVEVAECIATMRGEGPDDLVEVVVELVAEMLDVAGQLGDDRESEKERLRGMLDDGTALEVFREIVAAQDGDPAVCDDITVLPQAPHTFELEAWRDGVITEMDAEQIGLAAMSLGAGRATKEDTIDPGVGLVFGHKRGATVEAGQPLLQIHFSDREGLEDCRARLRRAITIEPEDAYEERPLILDRLG